MRILLIFLLLAGTALAQRFELDLAPRGVGPSPVGRDVEKCVDFFLELYKRAGPQLGCRFIESNYLLTLADFRARGAYNGFLAPMPAPGVVDSLNAWLVPQGLSLHVTQQEKGTVLDVVSLAGLEYSVGRTKLAWVAPYSRTGGWAAAYDWLAATEKRLADSQPLHSAPSNYLEGFLLGYPDIAIEGYLSPAGDHQLSLVTSTIPQVYEYVCGVPLFDVLATACDDPGVTGTEKSWNDFLTAVYTHPRLQPLLTSPEFLAARKERLVAHARLMFPELKEYPRRSLEAVRLGLAQAPPLLPEDLDTAMERRLRANQVLPRLEAASQPGEFCQDAQITDEALARWSLRGAVNPQDPANAVYQLVSKKWPAFYLDSLEAEIRSVHAQIPRGKLTQEYRSAIVTFLDLLTIPEFGQAFARLDAKTAGEIKEDVRALRHLPQAERWAKAWE